MDLGKKFITALIVFILFSQLLACVKVSDPAELSKQAEPLKAAKINVQMSQMYLQQGDIQRAQRKIFIALEQAPQSAIVLAGMAYFLAATGEPDQAEDYYQQALSQADGEEALTVNNNYAILLCERGRYQEGINHFLLAADTHDFVQASSAYENAGLCALKLADKDMAEKYFNRALKRDPQRVVSMLELSKLYYEQEKYEKAQHFLKRFHVFAQKSQESTQLSKNIEQKLEQKPKTIGKMPQATSSITTKVEQQKWTI